MMHIDLHTHTNVSDGKLSPAELVERAITKGVRVLSITDHDTTLAYQQLDLSASMPGLIPGIELSTYWNKTGIHIVGLNIKLDSNAITEANNFQQNARLVRAEEIAEKLERQGIMKAFDGARKIAGNDNIGRPHFAQHIVNTGAANSINEAFKKYLGAGKSGDIKKYWASLPRIVSWIRDAGGIAVLAHPLKYKLTRTRLVSLIDDFIDAGGEGMEVVSGNQISADTRQLARICNQKNLLASCGSDFHEPDLTWSELGEFSTLPKDCVPVWDRF